MKIRTTFIVMALALLAGCETPVNPAKIRFVYQPMLGSDPVDVIAISRPAHVGMPPGDLWGDPGEQVSLRFDVTNWVRDDVFVQADDAAAYVSSVMTYAPRAATGQIEPVGEARTVNPAAPAALYRLLLRLPQNTREEKQRGERDESSFSVQLPVRLPKGNWDRAEITVVFYLHGYTRETRGEFRDTMTQTVRVIRSHPTTRAATSAAAEELLPGMSFSRPLTQPATMPAPQGLRR